MRCSFCFLVEGVSEPRYKRFTPVFCRNPWVHGLVMGCILDHDNIWYYIIRSNRENVYFLAEDKLEASKPYPISDMSTGS